MTSLVKIATKADAVVQLPYRPGHFVVAGQVIARVWPPEAADSVAERLALGHVTGAYRTLPQDISFGFDQLVEIALRALSPAVNDTFTGMTCVDWIADCLCRISTSWHPQRIRRDADGNIRVIAFQPDFDRLVERTFDTIRQAAVGMPAIMIRQLDAIAKVIEQIPDRKRRTALIRQAEAIQRSNLATVTDPSDRDDVTQRYEAVIALVTRSLQRSRTSFVWPSGYSRSVTTELKADLVLSGGGVKGIGLAGAAVALLEAGYAIQRVSGTSAGSVVGAILAAGADELTPEQVEQLTMTLPYKKFLDPTRITGIPLLGPAWGVLSETGIYKGDYAHDWIRSELANLGVRTFGDLAIDDTNLPPEQRYRLVVTAADVTTGQLVRLPWDYRRLYGLDPDEQQVADAVRASMSIPFFFRDHQADQRERPDVDAGRRRHAVELPDRLLRPPGRQAATLADVRGHVAAQPSAGQRQGDSGSGAGELALRRPAADRSADHHDDRRPRPGLPESAVGRLAGDPRRLLEGRISRLQHRHQADAGALPERPQRGRGIPGIVELGRVPRAVPAPGLTHRRG